MTSIRYLIVLSILVSCQNKKENHSLIGQWALVSTNKNQSIYREIIFEEDSIFRELVGGSSEFEDKYIISNNFITIGEKKYQFSFEKNNILRVFSDTLDFTMKKVSTLNGIDKTSHHLRRFEYLGKNYNHLDSINKEKWKNDMVDFFIAKGDYPSGIDTLPDL